MCISFDMSSFERELVRQKLTRSTLDEWLKAETEHQEYRDLSRFFRQFGVHVGLDRQVSVDPNYLHGLMYDTSARFVRVVSEFVANPISHTFGAARDRLIQPKTDKAKYSLDLIPA